MEDEGREERPLDERDEGRQDVERGIGVEGGEGEDEEDGPREADVGTGEEEGEEEGMLKAW